MKRWREEKGSALVMVMFMMLILTLLGVTILSATVAGSRRTLTRENDIQSLQLTQKVLDESVAYISTKLNARVAQPNFDSKNLEAEINSIVNELKVDPTGGDRNVQTDSNTLYAPLGTLIKRPEVKEDLPTNEVPEEDPLKDLKRGTAYKITLTASGTVNGVRRTLTQEVKVNMYPDFLKYAFGSEQDLILNGAPYINGNIYAGDDLIVTNRPEYVYKGENLDTPSLYPKMVAGGLVYIQGLDDFRSGDPKSPEGVTKITAEGDAKVANRVDQALGITVDQLQIKDRQKFVRINVEESFIDKLVEALHPAVATQASLLKLYQPQATSPSAAMSAVVKTLETPGVKLLKMPEKPDLWEEPDESVENPDPTVEEVRKHNLDEYNRYTQQLAALQSELSNLSSTAIFQGDLVVDGDTFASLGTQAKSNWLIVDGNLTFAGEDRHTNLFSNVLVTGNVRFKDTVNVDSTMLVMGDTTIEEATILGRQEGSSEKEIVLISKGRILLNRVDEFKRDVQKLRGFFYTDSTAVLYGVGSNFMLEGGFFAKGNLRINAVVGDSQPGDKRINFATQGPDGSQATASRFKVTYNDEVYAHQRSGLPQVEQISISVGKIQLK